MIVSEAITKYRKTRNAAFAAPFCTTVTIAGLGEEL